MKLKTRRQKPPSSSKKPRSSKEQGINELK